MPIRLGDGTVVNPKGFSEVRLGDGSILWTSVVEPTTVLIDSFEDSDMSEWSGGNIGNVTFPTSHPDGIPEGTTFYQQDAGTSTEEWTSLPGDGLPVYYGKGDGTLKIYMSTSDHTENHNQFFYFGIVDTNNFYRFRAEWEGRPSPAFRLDTVVSGTASAIDADSTQATIDEMATDTWFIIKVTWDDGTLGGADNDITVTVEKKGTGDITTLSGNNADHETGRGLGISGFTQAGHTLAFDWIHYEPSNIVEDFEDNNLTDWELSDDAIISTAAAYNGTYGLEDTGGMFTYTNTAAKGPSPGDTFRCYFNMNWTDTPPILRFYFAIKTIGGTGLTPDEAYRLAIDDSGFTFQKRTTASGTVGIAGPAAWSPVQNTWYYVRVQWSETNEFIFTMHDASDDSQIGGTLGPVTDNEYTLDRGGIGFWGNAFMSGTYWDYFIIE